MPSSDYPGLTLTVGHDYDGDCDVTVSVNSGGFQGFGCAYFDISDVVDFVVAATKVLAATSAGQVALQGGWLSQDGTESYRVNLTMRPHDVRGYLLVLAQLASEPKQVLAGADSLTSHFVSRVSASLMVEPASLARFADQLATIPKGADVKAYLPGGDVT